MKPWVLSPAPHTPGITTDCDPSTLKMGRELTRSSGSNCATWDPVQKKEEVEEERKLTLSIPGIEEKFTNMVKFSLPNLVYSLEGVGQVQSFHIHRRWLLNTELGTTGHTTRKENTWGGLRIINAYITYISYLNKTDSYFQKNHIIDEESNYIKVAE